MDVNETGAVASTGGDGVGGSVSRHRHVVSSAASVPYQKMTTTTNANSINANTSLLQPGARLRRHVSSSTNRGFSPWIRKPLWAVHIHDDHDPHSDVGGEGGGKNDGNGNISDSSSSNTNNGGHQTNNNNQLHRHLTLFDLVCVGVGGTVGSGIFVLCGLIAHDYAGPATFLSWGIAGVAACLSGCCFAEMAGRIPSSGSSYAYTFVSMGELPAFVSAGCLTLEYLFSGAAVARSWGDKVVEWFEVEAHFTAAGEDGAEGELGLSPSSMFMTFLDPGWGLNPMAFLVSAVSTALLYQGVKESKSVTNFFSCVKVILVIFMTLGGYCLFDSRNYKPLLPPQLGVSGMFRGATSSFFGYIGYDEVCCLAGEAINPRQNMPRAVMLVITFVTVLYMTAAVALTGMQPYDSISPTSGFPVAFSYNNVMWAAHFSAFGEVVTLPIVVLITLMAQPRLQYALAEDGLLPPWFAEVDHQGNLKNGTLAAGVVMTLIATCVPFTYLNDLISAGILVAFTMTDCSVVLLRLESPDESPLFLEKLLVAFNVLCFSSALIIGQYWDSVFGRCTIAFLIIVLIANVCYISWKCPPRAVFGGGNDKAPGTGSTTASDVVFFQTPWVPYFPCLGAFVNWYLIAQLEASGLRMLLLYIILCVAVYYAYGAKHSLGNTRGWAHFSAASYSSVATVNDESTSPSSSSFDDEPNLLRSISLPRRGYTHDPAVTS
jgi:amino acid transporter